MTVAPNLFSYAPSELYQGAFLSWLLVWADEKSAGLEPGLHSLSVEFVNLLFKAANLAAPSSPYSVSVVAQKDRIDAAALIGDQHAINRTFDLLDTAALADVARCRGKAK